MEEAAHGALRNSCWDRAERRKIPLVSSRACALPVCRNMRQQNPAQSVSRDSYWYKRAHPHCKIRPADGYLACGDSNCFPQGQNEVTGPGRDNNSSLQTKIPEELTCCHCGKSALIQEHGFVLGPRGHKLPTTWRLRNRDTEHPGKGLHPSCHSPSDTSTTHHLSPVPFSFFGINILDPAQELIQGPGAMGETSWEHRPWQTPLG